MERDGMVRVFQQKFTLEDAFGSHACSLQACDQWHSSRESTALTVVTINYSQTLKACAPAVVAYTSDSILSSSTDHDLCHPLLNGLKACAPAVVAYL
jgi:hypothetical protein